MRMLQPSPGEAVDRQTILSLKMHHGAKKGMNVKAFVDENNELQRYLEQNFFLIAPKALQDPYDRAFNALKEVNRQLWDLEDEIRNLKIEFGGGGLSAQEMARVISGQIHLPASLRIIEISLLIPELNDRRAKLVQEINRLFGIYSQEKVFQV